MEINYEEDVSIDEMALDREWLEQPSLMMRYCKNAAFAKKKMNMSKEARDVKRAQVSKAIRKNPEEYGIVKITEGAIENEIITDDGFRAAVKTYHDSVYENDMAQSAISALSDKKAALESLVKLNGQSYFAGPSVPHDISRDWEKQAREERMNDKVRIKQPTKMTRGKKS